MQLQIKDELTRMGFWSTDCEDGLPIEDQGVYCVERSGDHRQLIVFAWLDSSLFEPEAIRNTPAYVLRFLITLSSNITCCLSQDDFGRVKSEVDAMSDSSSMRWNSCSVAFRVQKQVEQKDAIPCGEVTEVSIPRLERAKTAWFVGGVLSAVAVERATPSTTEMVPHNESMLIPQLAEWITMKQKYFAIHFPPKRVQLATHVRDELLVLCGQSSDDELSKLRRKHEKRLEDAKERLSREAYEYAENIYEEAIRNARMLFTAQKQYEGFLRKSEKCDVFRSMDYLDYKMVYLPERVQAHMKDLDEALKIDRKAFEDALLRILVDDPLGSESGGGSNLQDALDDRQPRLEDIWKDAVWQFVWRMEAPEHEQRIQQSTFDPEFRFGQEREIILQKAFDRFWENLKTSDGSLSIKISKLMCNSDGTAVNVVWSEEVEKEPTKVIRMRQLSNSSPAKISLMGTLEFEPDSKLLKIATVKVGLAIAVLVKGNLTIVRRIQFSLQKKEKALQSEVRAFPRVCSLCSIRANDRRVAFLFNVSTGRLGSVAFCRFNESFTSVEATLTIDMDASFTLASPLVDILLTERSLCAIDGSGTFQSFDVRTRRTSKKVDCKKENSDANWVGGLMSFADELVVGRTSMDGSKRLFVNCISNEDHRALPTAIFGINIPSTKLDIGSIGDVLYVVDTSNGTIYSSQLSVTVRSDAYRIQRSGNGAKTCRLQADQKTATEHWLRVFYHVFEKFPVRSLIDKSVSPDVSFSLDLEVVVPAGAKEEDRAGMGDTYLKYFNNLMLDLRRLNKPLSQLNLAKKLKCRCSEQASISTGLIVTSLRRVLVAIVSFVPVQICRAEDNMLRLLRDGEDDATTGNEAGRTSLSSENDSTGTDASEIAQSIRFGLLSPLLESWNGRCVVVTSMGKQSTGKSYFLNHLAGTSFAISGSRCTDGAWMSLRFVSDVLLVVLDFEGLGPFERSEQEDIFLSVLNASVSLFTVFRMESRFDKDIDGLFSRFQKGVQLIKNDPRLFRGQLFMNVKDVNMNDQQGVFDELVAKLETIFEANRDQNFLTDMYAGQLEINCSPPFGTIDYYNCMENDGARSLMTIVSESSMGFVTGKAFLDCLRIVLAKISILDWTSMDKSAQHFVVADTKQKLSGILRTGCHVSLPLVKDKTIPSHLKEEVLKVGSRERLVISLEDMCEAFPGFMTKWTSLNNTILLDVVKDEELDMGFDVTSLTDKSTKTVGKTIDMLFRYFLSLRGKTYEISRLTTEDQSDFDTFAALYYAVENLRYRVGFTVLWATICRR
ncbi:hypothetical protein F441_21783 [Phytophthora nicotianae CJ01A1]|uniref:VLIG-type G domain-containing protein n=1 Tax=Phytophthora nicotianae CJ01A1 TaxID=1317063 RepID=W2VR85_PHYNI|nr:hypothetical protein F441_21783 [Phytophthora nicotianae CJ01A1]